MTQTHARAAFSQNRKRILDTLIDAVDHYAQGAAPTGMNIGMNLEWVFDYFEFQIRTDA
ncbi:hypothetical protein N9B69_00810 [Amylibacter sp.]|nr:hypothetical protein [Amylibacter sp.]